MGCLTLFSLIPLGHSDPPPVAPGISLLDFWGIPGGVGPPFFGAGTRGPTRRLVFSLALSGIGRFYSLVVAAGSSQDTGKVPQKRLATLLIGGLFLFHILYPQYFKEVPRRWSLRLAPQVHILASEQILKTFGPGAVIASREPEVVISQ